MATGPWGTEGGDRIFRVNVLWEMALQKCQTGFHLRDVGLQGQTPESVATEVSPWVTTKFNTLLHQGDRIIGIDVVNLVTKEGHSINFGNSYGAVPGSPAPTFLTVPVSLKGSIRRRYANGRMLWPVRTEEVMNGNALHPDWVTAYNGVAQDLVDRFTGNLITAELHLVHAHQTLPALGNRPEVPATWYDVTSVRVNTLISSLKRRKVGVGS